MKRKAMGYVLAVTAAAGLSTQAYAQTSQLRGEPIDQNYVNEFQRCDKTNVFEGVQFPIRNAAGEIIWYGCGDRSEITRLERIAAIKDGFGKVIKPMAILWDAKMARDDDGSEKACSGKKGTTDLCTTALMLKPTKAWPCPQVILKKSPKEKYCRPVDADAIPYIVVPRNGPKGIDRPRFMRTTGIGMGDLGVVIAHGKIIPAIVADTGPANKIGEGSAALLRKLGAVDEQGKVGTLPSGVMYIVFPGTSLTNNANVDSLAEDIERKGLALYQQLVQP